VAISWLGLGLAAALILVQGAVSFRCAAGCMSDATTTTTTSSSSSSSCCWLLSFCSLCPPHMHKCTHQLPPSPPLICLCCAGLAWACTRSC
jgi:hypothetical protein